MSSRANSFAALESSTKDALTKLTEQVVGFEATLHKQNNQLRDLNREVSANNRIGDVVTHFASLVERRNEAEAGFGGRQRRATEGGPLLRCSNARSSSSSPRGVTLKSQPSSSVEVAAPSERSESGKSVRADTPRGARARLIPQSSAHKQTDGASSSARRDSSSIRCLSSHGQ